jgi:protocatechuate 3,4-dioxygenase beta subunit
MHEHPTMVLSPGRGATPARRAPRQVAGVVLAALLLGAPAWAAAATVVISGRLAAQDGHAGVPSGARIELLPAVLDREEARRQLETASPRQPEPLVTARPAGDGTFTVQAPGPGTYRVVVSAPGYLAIELLLPLIEDQELPPARLVPASPVELRAVGPRGEPLPGLLVSLHRAGYVAELVRPGWRPAERTVMTGPGGRLELQREAGAAVAATVLDPRFFGQLLWPVEAPSPVPVGGATAHEILRLTDRPAVVLEAEDAGGRPLAGALLRSRGGRAIAIAGSDGRMRISLAQQRYSAGLGGPTIESPGGEQAATVDWAGVRGGRLRVRLTPLPTTSGQLVDAATGESITGGLVWAERGVIWDGMESTMEVAAVAATAADGQFKLRLPPGAGLRWKAGAPGHLTARAPAPAGTSPWRIRLERAADLTGRVVDGAGRAVAGAEVRAHATGGTFDDAAATADVAGHFRLRALAPGRHYQLTASAAEFVPASALALVPIPGSPRVTAGRAGAAEVRIVLGPGLTATGRVVDRTGRPLPGITVALTSSRIAAATMPQRAVQVLSQLAAGRDAWRASTDAHGAFELRHLPPGRCQLLVGGPGFVTTMRRDVEIPATGARLDLGRIALDTGVTILGMVTDQRGAPIKKATITFKPLGGGLGNDLQDRAIMTMSALGPGSDATATGPDGRFVIADVRAGQRFELVVTHPEHPMARIPDVSAPSAEPLRIVLPDGFTLTGRVVDAAGEPVLGAAVSLFSPPGPGYPLRPAASVQKNEDTGADGRFTITGLGAGIFDLSARADGFRTAYREGVRVAADQETPPVEVMLDTGSSLHGVVRDGAGKPVAGVFVVAFRPITSIAEARRSSVQTPANTDEDGAYRITGLDQGSYRVGAGAGAGAGRGTTVEILAGDNELDLVLDRSNEKESEVTGRIADPSGTPIAGAALWLAQSSSQASNHLTSSLSDGSFIFSHVTPGSYVLGASARGFAALADPPLIELTESPVEGLELTLDRADTSISGRLLGLEPEELAQVRVVAAPIGSAGVPDASAMGAATGTGASGGGEAAANGWLLSQRDSFSQAPGSVDETGAYRVTGLAPGAWKVTAVTDSGRNASGQVTLSVEAPIAVLDLDFAGGITLGGRFSVDTRPVAGAQVYLAVAETRQATSQVTTGADGTFRFSTLKPGSYTLAAMDSQDLIAVALPVALAADQEIALDIATGTLRCKVVTATGDPVAGAALQLQPTDLARGGPLLAQAATDASGAFELTGVPANLYRVTASKEGTGTAKVNVTVAPGDVAVVEIVLAPAPAPQP